MENKYTSNQIVKNGNNDRTKIVTATQEMQTSSRITIPQQIMIKKMKIPTQQVIYSSKMNFMMKKVMKINTIFEWIIKRLLMNIRAIKQTIK